VVVPVIIPSVLHFVLMDNPARNPAPSSAGRAFLCRLGHHAPARLADDSVESVDSLSGRSLGLCAFLKM
jgi:hypothetical protein